MLVALCGLAAFDGLAWAENTGEPLLPPRTKKTARTRVSDPRQYTPFAEQEKQAPAAPKRATMASDVTPVRLAQDEQMLEPEPDPAIATDAPVVEDQAPTALPEMPASELPIETMPGPNAGAAMATDEGCQTGCPTGSPGSCAVGDCNGGCDGACNGSCDAYGGCGGCDACGGCGGAGCGACRGGLLSRWCACGSMFESFWHEVHSGRRIWFETQALSWYTRSINYPPLATSSPDGTPQAVAGVLGQPTTTVLFGNQDLDNDPRAGGRINFGLWLIDGQFLGVQGDYFALDEEKNTFSAESTGDPILARPFNNVQTMTPDASIIAGNGITDPRFGTALVDLDGSIVIDTHSRTQGGGIGLRKPTWVSFDDNYRVNLLGGYRYFRLDEGVSIHDTVFPQGGPFVPGTSFQTFDLFDTENEFHGGEIGMLLEFRKSVWSLDLLGRVALGNMRQRMEVQGYSVIDDTINQAVVNDGLLAQSTNIGMHRVDEFCAIPEFGAKVGLSVTDYFRVTFGYTFIYISSVVRADDQIDLNLNLSQAGGGVLVGSPEPAAYLRDTDYWLQGINLGGELKF
ncbi:MAG: BBP7 family outer membrane beta-barrel protein [Pirellulales bacterium]|nr:BBP7 family outer membrane beta-barrel protein [Pirellulales bacterium]